MRYVTLCLLLCLATVGYGQLQRGDRLLGILPSLSFHTQTATPLADDNLGRLSFAPVDNTAEVRAATDYGWMLSSRLAVGAAGSFYAGRSDYGSTSYLGLAPFFRYYFMNRTNLMLFGELSTSAFLNNFARVTAFNSMSARVGLHYPLAAGVLLTPSIAYGSSEGYNGVYIGAGIQLVLGKNTRPEERAVGSLQRGNMLAGAQAANLSFYDGEITYGTKLGGYYFLSNRFALGVTLGGSRSGQQYFNGIRDEKIVYYTIGVGLGTRYYLNTEQHILWFIEAGASYDKFIRQSRDRGYDDGDTAYVLGGGGAQIFLRSNVALELGPQLRYRLPGGLYNKRFDLGLNFGIRFLL